MINLDLLVKAEEKRQEDTLMLIPSENYASKKVREYVGSRLSNKYSEGYPKRRYYQGNNFVDEIELLAIEKAKKLFKVPHANVQPYSGSPANSEILFALCDYKDKIMGLKLSAGGHLTHGHPDITFSGKYFESTQFDLDSDGLINYSKVEALAKETKPKVMIIGTTAYPLAFDWKKFGEIADSVNAYLVADISHVSGLIIGGVYPDPSKFAHILMTTTHKTLRGPRGAMIMVTEKGIKKDPELPTKIDKAVFPGLQGGPHNNTTAGIAQALNEADSDSFRKYASQIVKNAKALSDLLKKEGLTLVGDTTECHLMVIDLRPLNLSGNIIAEALEEAGIIVNRNSVPFDEMPPFYPSGIRIGTPAVTTRGLKEKDMKVISDWIVGVINHVKEERLPKEPEQRKEFISRFRTKVQNDKYLKDVSNKVKKYLEKYPIP
jgi:glycine hydroxymethyltransferase